MIESIGFAPHFSSAPNSVKAPQEIPQPFNTVLKQTVRHGYVGDGQVLPVPDEETIEMLNEMLSALDGSYNIWDIVLQLEEKVDIDVLLENISADFDNPTGRSIVEVLLTQLWKKKELSGENITKYDILAYFKQNHIYGDNQNHIDSKTISELEEIILKNKQKGRVTAI